MLSFLNKLSLLCLLMFFSSGVYSQFEVGFKVGANSSLLKSDSIFYQNDDRNLELVLDNVNIGYHFGMYAKVEFFGIFLEPSFLFNSSRAEYKFNEFGQSGIIEMILKETYRRLDIPFMVGYKSGFISLHGGPVAHIQINTTSDLFEINGYNQKFKTATFGYQLGIGIDFWKLGLDLNYENNFSKFGEHISINDQNYTFDQNPSRILTTLSYKF